MSFRTGCAALGFVCFASWASADSQDTMERRIDAVSDAQILSIFQIWFRSNGEDCAVALDSGAERDVARRMQGEITSSIFELADVSPADQPTVETHLNRRVEGLIGGWTQSGDMVIERSDETSVITVPGCEAG